MFYGSQTGTAEGFAFDLAKTLQLFGISGLVIDPEDIHLVHSSPFSGSSNKAIAEATVKTKKKKHGMYHV